MWRIDMSNFKESLYQKHGFLYQIGDHYYAIGANIFAEIKDTAEIDNVELLQNAVKKNNERQIAKYLDKLIRIAETYRVDAKEHYRQRDKLFAFIDTMEKENEDDYLNLQEQVCKFDELFEKYSKHSQANTHIE